MALTTDQNDPQLKERRGDGQQAVYLVLSEEELAKGFVRPVRRSYIHRSCGTVTTMAQAIAETYARNPSHYGATYCAACRDHLLVAEFNWVEAGEDTGLVVGS